MNRLLVAVAVGALSLSACKQQGTSVSKNETQGMTDEAPVENLDTGNGLTNGSAAASAADQTYVQNAAASDMFEIESSKLALQKATLPAAKTYADLMIAEHTKSSTELKAAAQSVGVAVPTALPADKQAKLSALQGLSGTAFDRQYLADQRVGHQETLAKANEYLATNRTGPLGDHAAKLTGVVQKHLNSLEKIK